MQKQTETTLIIGTQVLLSALLLAWVGLLPPTLMLFTAVIFEGTLPAAWHAAPPIVLLTGLAGLPCLALTLLTRHRPRWQKFAALSATLLGVSGFLVLEATCRALAPARPNLAAALQLGLLLPYLLLAAWIIPWLAGQPRRSPLAWLGLDRFDAPTWLLAPVLVIGLSLPWAVTGALGDRHVSLALIWQTLAVQIPLALLLWGLAFTLLTSAWDTAPWLAALVILLLHPLAVSAGILPHENLDAVLTALFLPPLTFLLTELRARPGGVLPVLPVLIGYLLLPRLFTDPRDIAMRGVPQFLHILVHMLIWITLILLGLGLWLSRWIAREFETWRRAPRWIGALAYSGLALLLTVTWVGAYLGLGSPGFHDDSFLIFFEAQADLEPAYAIADREERSAYVYAALVATAEESQAPVRAELERRGWTYRPYYIINMIRVEGQRHRMDEFAEMPGVARVLLNPNVRVYPYPEGGMYTQSPAAPGYLPGNLQAIRVEEAWQLGVTGAGIVVAGQDTGYDWQHPALQGSYRGWDGATAQHDYNWHDAWDASREPFDADGHGTHTMGTMVGDDGDGNRVGVAPGAQWIGCRNMRQGLGNPGSYAECMEFFLAPFPWGGDSFTQGDVRLAPHVINNSWGCPPEEGCEPDTLEPAVDALHAAGIMMVVSAGNEGPGCASVMSPPALYANAFSVGATTDAGFVTNFSSRGPVGDLLKPDVSAPGSGVRSSLPGDGYGTASGTSMAGPHVAGLVTLLWAANPDLIGDIDATARLICATAQPRPVTVTCATAAPTWAASECACGEVSGVPNNVYGCGIIDAGAAVQMALETLE